MENELVLRLDETLKNFTAWLNSHDAVRYRPVICMYSIFKAHDDSGIGELEEGYKQGGQPEGTRSYAQRLTQYGPDVSCFATEIQYHIFPQKNGVIVTLIWMREMAGAVWDLLEKIALRWPETRETITVWQASAEGQKAYKAAQAESWWQSPKVREIRAAAAEAIVARTMQTQQHWAALPYAEQYERVLTYFRGFTPEQVRAWKPGLDRYLKSHFFRAKSFAEWDSFISLALERYPQWAQEEYKYHLRQFVIPEDMMLQDSNSLHKWQVWAAMTEAARQDWIAQGGPFEFIAVAWEDLPASQQAAYEQAITAWGKLCDEERKAEKTVSPGDVGAPVGDGASIEGRRAAAGEVLKSPLTPRQQDYCKVLCKVWDAKEQWEGRPQIVKKITTQMGLFFGEHREQQTKSDLSALYKILLPDREKRDMAQAVEVVKSSGLLELLSD